MSTPPQAEGARQRPPAVTVDRIAVTYRNGHTPLCDISFELPCGSIAALAGMNGSGKSTLFKAIAGFLPLTTGNVAIFGRSVQAALKSNCLAYVPQCEEVDWHFPVLVEDVVMMGRYGHMNMLRIARKEDRDAVTAALARVDICSLRKRQIGELSCGQKKRVFLARALAQGAPLLLLDEPFNGVDATTEKQIIQLLQALRADGHTILLSTHNLRSVSEYCDRALLIKRTLLAAGPIAEVFTPTNLEGAFGRLPCQRVPAVDMHQRLGGCPANITTDASRGHCADCGVEKKISLPSADSDWKRGLDEL